MPKQAHDPKTIAILDIIMEMYYDSLQVHGLLHQQHMEAEAKQDAIEKDLQTLKEKLGQDFQDLAVPLARSAENFCSYLSSIVSFWLLASGPAEMQVQSIAKVFKARHVWRDEFKTECVFLFPDGSQIEYPKTRSSLLENYRRIMEKRFPKRPSRIHSRRITSI